MSVRLRVSRTSTAAPGVVWRELVDWAGQDRWIPFTTVTVTSDHAAGLGVRCEALSGSYLGRVPVGLLDRFVVTGWSPPTGDAAGELEVLHLGPYFTGEGVFRLEPDPSGGTSITATELITVPGGAATQAPVRWSLPLLRVGFGLSLGRLARLCEGRR